VGGEGEADIAEKEEKKKNARGAQTFTFIYFIVAEKGNRGGKKKEGKKGR